MKSEKTFLMTLAYLFPALTLMCAAGIFFSPRYHSQFGSGEILPLIFFLFAVITSVAGLVIAALLDSYTRKNALLTKEIDQNRFKDSILSAKTKEDELVKESLSAMREIANKINNDVDMGNIVAEVLRQISGFIGAREGQEITLYLLDEFSSELLPMAHLMDNKVFLEDELKKIPIDRNGVNETFENCQTQFASYGGNEIGMVLPVSVAGKVAGVLKIKTIHEGASEEKSNWLKIMENNLRSFMSVFSLAIRTPDFYKKSVLDGLTGLYTKRHFITQLDYWIKASQRENEPFSLIILDIDNFKIINDTYGHLAGDMVIKEMVGIVQKSIRSTSQAFRYGGEEFTVILPDTALKDAEVVAERLRKKVEKSTFMTEDGTPLKLTVSLGIAQWDNSMAGWTHLVSAADKALYRAKDAGRNRSCLAE